MSNDIVAAVGSLMEGLTKRVPMSFREMAALAGLDPSKDFVGVDISGLDLRDEDLAGFNFSGANLSFVDFRRAKLDGVSFAGARMDGAIGYQRAEAVQQNDDLRQIKRNLAAGILPDQEFIDACRTLRFGDTAVYDISFLHEFKYLKALSLRNRRIQDYSPISSLRSLEVLELDGSNINSLAGIYLSENIKSFTARSCPISNIGGLDHLSMLADLDISRTAVVSLENVSRAPLVRLRAEHSRLANLSHLSCEETLSSLDVTGCLSLDAHGVERFRALNHGYFSSVSYDFSDFLEGVAAPISLNIDLTLTRSLVGLAGKSSLRRLRASLCTKIEGVSRTLNDLPNLTHLNVAGCDLEALIDLSRSLGIKEVDVSKNRYIELLLPEDIRMSRVALSGTEFIQIHARNTYADELICYDTGEDVLNSVVGALRFKVLYTDRVSLEMAQNVALEYGSIVVVSGASAFELEQNSELFDRRIKLSRFRSHLTIQAEDGA